MNRIHTFRLGPPPADQGLGAMLGWIVAVIVGGFAVLIGALFALFAGLAVAIVAGFAWLAVMLARLTGRRPSRSQPARPGPMAQGEGEIIDAHKVGDQWVAYGYDQPSR
ncbi:hypothetical protein [Brevundimonas aveniformis]|uniref:hypothetical protein n=1 Tax=Brevundimonas aveniformis TaxID=370977 RepID=UPI0004098F19|nr:hypothetical protein [Brevundimonas aveniformis]